MDEYREMLLYAYDYKVGAEQPKRSEQGFLQLIPIEEETVFLEHIRSGNKEKARKTMGILLDRFIRITDISAIIPQLFELLAITFRVAAQVADLRRAGALKIKLSKDLRQVDSCEKAIAWGEQMMTQYIDLICQESNTTASQKVIRKANEYIEENFSRDISLNEIAEYVHLSSSYFSRLYKQVTKGNLVDFINSVRIKHAKELLVTSDHDIDYIAFAVGFNTHNYFTTVFRRFEAMTPSEYRMMKLRGTTIVQYEKPL